MPFQVRMNSGNMRQYEWVLWSFSVGFFVPLGLYCIRAVTGLFGGVAGLEGLLIRERILLTGLVVGCSCGIVSILITALLRTKIWIFVVAVLTALGLRCAWLLYADQFNWENGEYRKPLCGNYSLVRLNEIEAIIIGRREIHDVEKYSVKPPYITGYTSERDQSPELEFKSRRYFFLDTTSDDEKLGLTLEEWSRETSRSGWKNPQLQAPPFGLWESLLRL